MYWSACPDFSPLNSKRKATAMLMVMSTDAAHGSHMLHACNWLGKGSADVSLMQCWPAQIWQGMHNFTHDQIRALAHPNALISIS